MKPEKYAVRDAQDWLNCLRIFAVSLRSEGQMNAEAS
jgi:hypothetical protein